MKQKNRNPVFTTSMNEIIRFTTRHCSEIRYSRTVTLLILSALILALGACQSSQSLSGYMESKYSLKKRKTYISRLSEEGAERCTLPIPVTGRQYRKMLESIERSKGIPYRFGGTTTEGFDCSGFVQYLFSDAFQLQLPRTSIDLAHLGEIIPRNEIRKGDLLFFSTDEKINHVGVYLGDGRFAHAATTSGISISPITQRYYEIRFAFATRVIEVK